MLVPTYTPIRTDETDVSEHRVFLGGINMFLQQKLPLLRSTPRWLDRWLSHPSLIKLATSRAAAVDPAKLGDMTVSMLRGEQGHQAKELAELVDWLKNDIKPDIVHFSNSMMLGIARSIADGGSSRIVCSLSGEDIFLEKLTAPYYDTARGLLAERADEVDAFVALNRYYADFMSDYMAVNRDRVHVVPHGLDLAGHPRNPREPRTNKRQRIGYFARICHDKGLHQLIAATERLAKESPKLDFEVIAAGYLGSGDRHYLKEIERRVAQGPLGGRFRYEGEVDRAAKIELLGSFDLMCLPTIYRESKGISVLESLATGTPVVLPDHGSFPELVTETGGGLLYPAGDERTLIDRLSTLLTDRPYAHQLGENGRKAVHERFHAEAMAENTLEIYRRLLASQ